ncbi:hypothetical protein D3C86_1708240 [compost metagenome]
MINPYPSFGRPDNAALRRDVLQHDQLRLAVGPGLFTGYNESDIANRACRQTKRIIQPLALIGIKRVTSSAHSNTHIT